MMNTIGVMQSQATKAVINCIGDALVVASVGYPTFDLFLAGDRAQNFYTWGGMGLASSMGLGLALTCPERKVVVLDGDGSILMNLGSWATISSLNPPNLIHIVWDNGQYELTGGQKSQSGFHADLAGIASASGIQFVHRVSSERELLESIKHAMSSESPAVIIVNTKPRGGKEKLPIQSLKYRYLNTELFMEASGALPTGTSGSSALANQDKESISALSSETLTKPFAT